MVMLTSDDAGDNLLREPGDVTSATFIAACS